MPCYGAWYILDAYLKVSDASGKWKWSEGGKKKKKKKKIRKEGRRIAEGKRRKKKDTLVANSYFMG
ncbi:hypothetical protein QG37_08323 [Candidozyma auris]|uniref:Uncharacterized protein n=1 Tax=Candidozyma auris TaxID=498019 RepID=A0A0L0NN18_CANAR|nr:hypothetical protein QG37_08323 [[Candida] auris]